MDLCLCTGSLVFTHLDAVPQRPTPEGTELGERVLKGIIALGGLVTAGLGLLPWKSPPSPNPYCGFRIRETLEDPEVWYLANRFAGAALAAAGLVGAAAAVFLPVPDAAGVLVLAVLLATLVSYVYVRKIARRRS